MYGKVIAASGTAYLLTFQTDILPPMIGTGVLVMSGVVVAMDFMVDGPTHRLESFLSRCRLRIELRMSRAEKAAELRAAAQAELRMNHGIRMADELTDEERNWLREQAAMALKDYDVDQFVPSCGEK